MSNDISSDKIKEKFIEIYKASIKREGSEELLNYLQSSDFFSAPASTRYHGNTQGGLCYHSLMVYSEASKLLKLYTNIQVSQETLAICTLLHDVCKVNYYTESTRNVKKDGSWVQEPYYTVDEKFAYGGHGSKSVFIVNKYMKLTEEEAVAINCHMGPWDTDNYSSISNAFKQFPLAWLVHVADECCTYLLNA